jgi:hypothetical protein
MAQLRPLVSGQPLYERLLADDRPPFEVDLPLATLCKEILRTDFACLVPLGPTTLFLREPLLYPSGAPPSTRPLQTTDWTPDLICVPLEPNTLQRARWAVPLWSEHGLIGALLLGNKEDSGLNVKEDMEVARAVGERLIDALATSELSQRLVRSNVTGWRNSKYSTSERGVCFDEVLLSCKPRSLNQQRT